MSRLFVYDFTLSVRKSTNDHNIIIEELRSFAKKYVFQKELSDGKGNIIDENDWEFDDIFNEDGDFKEDFNIDEWSDSDDESIKSEITCSDNELEMGDDSLSSDFSLKGSYDSDDSDSSYSEESVDSQGRFEHYQGRLSLIKKMNIKQLKEMLGGANMNMYYAHFSGTSAPAVGQCFYAQYLQKLPTRIDGPWRDDTYEQPIRIPKQIGKDPILKPFQKELKDRCHPLNSNSREIIYVVNKKGGCGKTFWSLYMACNKLATIVPPFNSMSDICQAIMGQPKNTGCYIIDQPRGASKKNQGEFWAGIEMIKGGYVYDKRYSYKYEIIDSPTIVVFGNVLPEKKHMSLDRWTIYHIVNDELYLYGSEDIKGPEYISDPHLVANNSDSEEDTDSEEMQGLIDSPDLADIDISEVQNTSAVEDCFGGKQVTCNTEAVPLNILEPEI